MVSRQPEACYARLVFAMLSNNFFQIPARGRGFDSAAPQVFPTESQ
jgi:hypothetical protein